MTAILTSAIVIKKVLLTPITTYYVTEAIGVTVCGIGLPHLVDIEEWTGIPPNVGNAIIKACAAVPIDSAYTYCLTEASNWINKNVTKQELKQEQDSSVRTKWIKGVRSMYIDTTRMSNDERKLLVSSASWVQGVRKMYVVEERKIDNKNEAVISEANWIRSLNSMSVVSNKTNEVIDEKELEISEENWIRNLKAMSVTNKEIEMKVIDKQKKSESIWTQFLTSIRNTDLKWLKIMKKCFKVINFKNYKDENN